MIPILVFAVVVGILLWYINQPQGSSRSPKVFTARDNSSRAKPASKFTAIGNNFKTIEELQAGLRKAGLESSNLIIGIDYTKSNEWTGQKTFGGRCLHSLSDQFMNPYQTVIKLVGETLEAFDDDKLIPAFGFGDAKTGARRVFPFKGGAPCQGFQEVLEKYTEITPKIQLSGPTNFAPIIREAIKITKSEKSYHILLIIADGQVSPEMEKETKSAIIEASKYPLSIILVGVGDGMEENVGRFLILAGPWDLMNEFDDELPEREFDNFQFVEFHEIMTKYDGDPITFTRFALMEIPEQYIAVKNLKLLE